jgi:hypothetical protein
MPAGGCLAVQVSEAIDDQSTSRSMRVGLIRIQHAERPVATAEGDSSNTAP